MIGKFHLILDSDELNLCGWIYSNELKIFEQLASKNTKRLCLSTLRRNLNLYQVFEYFPNIEELTICDCFLHHINVTSTKLKVLRFVRVNISDIHFDSLVKNFPNLEIFDVRTAYIKHIIGNLKQLNFHFEKPRILIDIPNDEESFNNFLRQEIGFKGTVLDEISKLKIYSSSTCFDVVAFLLQYGRFDGILF